MLNLYNKIHSYFVIDGQAFCLTFTFCILRQSSIVINVSIQCLQTEINTIIEVIIRESNRFKFDVKFRIMTIHMLTVAISTAQWKRVKGRE